LLAKAGYRVAAATGKASEAAYLERLGATTILDRNDFAGPGKALQKERWAGVIDSAGSHTLANACAQTQEGGVVIACGLAHGMDFPASVAPLILRGITIVGIESVRMPKPRRVAAWERLARDLDASVIESIAVDIGLSETIEAAQRLVDGSVRGRMVVDVAR
jgi:acrylyl-CoA reductase (NADPH)